MNKEKMKLALEVLKAAYVPADLDEQRERVITAFEAELAKPDFWEGYVPEPVKPAQCAPAADGVCESLDCPNHKPAQQEPVAFFDPQSKGFYWAKPTKVIPPVTVDVEPLPLYTSPPAQRKWQGLTDEEIEKLTVELRDIPVTLAFAIEAKLKEKNNV